jgi:GR25 family glycosyltransferase involved in LPS biosynthesis
MAATTARCEIRRDRPRAAVRLFVGIHPRENHGADVIPAYCIIDDRHPERTEAARVHFAERGLAVKFWRGIHGKTWGLRTTHIQDPGLPLKEDGRYTSPGHIGLILAHWNLWQHIHLVEHEEALILENDALLVEDFPAKLDASMRQLPENWQLCYVGWIEDKNGCLLRQYRPNVVKWSSTYGTHCYAVRRSALPILMETNSIAKKHIDQQITTFSLPHLNYYALDPSLAKQRTETGDWTPSCIDIDAPK